MPRFARTSACWKARGRGETLLKSGTAGLRRCVAEFIGTFLLVFAGPGAVVIDAVSEGGVTSLGIGLSFGLAVMAAIYAVGHLSGAHINPAVTVVFALTRHFPWASRYPGTCSPSSPGPVTPARYS